MLKHLLLLFAHESLFFALKQTFKWKAIYIVIKHDFQATEKIIFDGMLELKIISRWQIEWRSVRPN